MVMLIGFALSVPFHRSAIKSVPGITVQREVGVRVFYLPMPKPKYNTAPRYQHKVQTIGRRQEKSHRPPMLLCRVSGCVLSFNR